MFVMNVDKNIATISQTEKMTSGSSKVYLVEFYFSPEWEDLSRVAVFRSGDTIVDVLLDESNVCFMPWEVLVTPKVPIYFGVYGTKDGGVVLPTIWAKTADILEGVIVGAASQEPSRSLYEQLFDRIRIIDSFKPITINELEEILV